MDLSKLYTLNRCLLYGSWTSARLVMGILASTPLGMVSSPDGVCKAFKNDLPPQGF